MVRVKKLGMDWDKLRIFHTVGTVGSLTHAGERLNLSQSAVSRQIRALEENLKAILFHRHARGLILTEQGELLHKTTNEIFKRLNITLAQIRDSRDEIFGELRVTTSIGFGTLWLAPRIRHLYDLYPNLKIDLILTEHILDLPMREADIAIRMKDPSQADLIRRPLMKVNMALYATQDYLASFGTPRTFEDLCSHRIISQNLSTHQVNESLTWIRTFLCADHKSHLTVNNYFGVLQATMHGVGIGVLPNYITDNISHLVRVLPQEQSSKIPVFLAYPSELRHSKRINAFRDFIIKEIK